MTCALDTNVLIRYMVRDDIVQYALAERFIQSEKSNGQPTVVTLLVALESEWVLRRSYRYSKPEIVAVFAALLGARDVRIENEPVLERALLLWQQRSVNFANCLILANSLASGCDSMLTFDKRAAKLPDCYLLN